MCRDRALDSIVEVLRTRPTVMSAAWTREGAGTRLTCQTHASSGLLRAR